MKKASFCLCLIGCLLAPPLRADEVAAPEASASSSATSQTAGTGETSPTAEIALLGQEVAALRQQLRQNTAAIRAAGTASDLLLAEQVTIRESLLLKERRLKQLTFAQREAQADGEARSRRELQQALAEADGPEARAALLARHRAYQRALAAEKALQSPGTDTASTSTP